MIRRCSAVGLLCALLGVLPSGCGGGDIQVPTPAPPPPRREWLRWGKPSQLRIEVQQIGADAVKISHKDSFLLTDVREFTITVADGNETFQVHCNPPSSIGSRATFVMLLGRSCDRLIGTAKMIGFRIVAREGSLESTVIPQSAPLPREK